MKNTHTSLVILDGFGIRKATRGNIILAAKTPNLDRLWSNYPSMLLKAAEEEVGLSTGEMGNSEVGHLTIGTGRIILQPLTEINYAIDSGEFFKKPSFLKAIQHIKNNNSTLHFIGLASAGAIHSHINHLLVLLKLAKKHNLTKIAIHPILDGRDSGKQDAPIFIKTINNTISESNITAKIGSISGRFYAMDRDNSWQRTQKAYEAITGSSKNSSSDTPLEIIEKSYQQGVFDERFLPVTITTKEGKPIGAVKPNDAIIFFNFRQDRARQIARAFALSEFDEFKRTNHPSNLLVVTMTEYEKDSPVLVAFPHENVTGTLSDTLSQNNIHQLHLSETEKFAHVTYFFNGGVYKIHPLEKFYCVPTKKIDNLANIPEMSAFEITKIAINYIINGPKPSFLLVNFANPDMIGHTGNMNATISAVETIDHCIGNISKAVTQTKANLFITADHGNAESMLTIEADTSDKKHTLNPVPFISQIPKLKKLNANTYKIGSGQNTLEKGVLADIAPTILATYNIPPDPQMTGINLIPSISSQLQP